MLLLSYFLVRFVLTTTSGRERFNDCDRGLVQAAATTAIAMVCRTHIQTGTVSGCFMLLLHIPKVKSKIWSTSTAPYYKKPHL